MRTGNPWVNGSVSPFIETASIASRPSMATAVGVPTVKPSTDRDTIWSAPGWTPASSSNGFERSADPSRVPDVGAADLVRHTRQRDVALDQVARHQVVERQLHLVVDHAVDRQAPAVRVDPRDHERGVHAVEVGVGRDERREAGRVEAGRRRRRHIGRRGDRQRVARGLGDAESPGADEPAESAGHDGRAADRERGEQEPSSIDVLPASRADLLRLPTNDGWAALRSQVNAYDPANAPTIDGTTERTLPVGRLNAATAPTAARTQSPVIPIHGRRIDAMPRTAARMRITTIIPTISARLSFTPNVRIANDFSHSGVASIMALPTATSGDDWSSMKEATTSAIPRAKSAVSTPTTAPRDRGVSGLSDAGAAGSLRVLTLMDSSRWVRWTSPGSTDPKRTVQPHDASSAGSEIGQPL